MSAIHPKADIRGGAGANVRLRPVADIAAAAHTSRMEAVFNLHHNRPDGEFGDDAKLIGVYLTESDAQAASERLARLPGFAEHPTGWHMDRYVLGEDHWQEGFGLAEPAEPLNVR